MNPFELDGPLVVSFSGGRTSGYMLRKILDAGLPDEHAILFANTGKEREETLVFVRDVATHWNVPIVWLEWRDDRQSGEKFQVVSFDTAARDGEPFEALIDRKRFLPNPVTRYCTQNLKIEVIKQYCRKVLGWTGWTSAIGIRYDEPSRWRVRGVHPRAKHEERVIPLADAKVTEQDVLSFWLAQPFDLQLEPWEGNCDLCFLKGTSKRARIIRDSPELSDWWEAQERKAFGKTPRAARFRADAPPYRALRREVERQPMLPMFEDEDRLPCLCTD